MAAPKRILIVGGGFTGLTAALRLSADHNNAITVVESRDKLGGLAAGFPLAGTSLEKTYHHLFLTDTAILNLIQELGLADKLKWCESSVAIFRDGKIHPFKTPQDLLRFAPCNPAGRIRTGLTALYLKHQKNWRGFTRVTAQDWMTRACGCSAMDTIWTPLLRGKFGRHFDRVSMAWLWARLHTRANSRAAGGEKLGYLDGGFKVIITALETELLNRGVTLRPGTTVETFLADERAAVIQGDKVPFDVCAFTGPSSALVRLLPASASSGDYAARLRRINYLGAACLIFTSGQSLGDHYWVNVNEPDAPFLVFLQHTCLTGKEAYGGKNVYYIGAYLEPDGEIFSLSDEDLTRRWFGYLPKLFPEFDARQVEQKFIFRFRDAQHIVDTGYEEKIPAHQTPLPGVFLANFSQIFPEDRGTNFAVREGEKIAGLIQRTLTP